MRFFGKTRNEIFIEGIMRAIIIRNNEGNYYKEFLIQVIMRAKEMDAQFPLPPGSGGSAPVEPWITETVDMEASLYFKISGDVWQMIQSVFDLNTYPACFCSLQTGKHHIATDKASAV